MKALITSIAVLVLFAGQANAADLKVGYVSVEKILTEAPQVEAVNKTMMERFGDRKTELENLEKEIQSMQENYKRNELVMTEDKLNDLKNRIIGKIQEFKQKEAALTQEVGTMRNQELAVLQSSVRSIILDIAKSGEYDLVLSEGVVYASDKLDITEQVLSRMKKAFDKGK